MYGEGDKVRGVDKAAGHVSRRVAQSNELESGNTTTPRLHLHHLAEVDSPRQAASPESFNLNPGPSVVRIPLPP